MKTEWSSTYVDRVGYVVSAKIVQEGVTLPLWMGSKIISAAMIKAQGLKCVGPATADFAAHVATIYEELVNDNGPVFPAV